MEGPEIKEMFNKIKVVHSIYEHEDLYEIEIVPLGIKSLMCHSEDELIKRLEDLADQCLSLRDKIKRM